MNLQGAVVLVTGSATGVGASCVQRLAQKGANVVINYTKSREEAEATAKACRDFGVETELVQANVADDEQCRSMVHKAISRWGRIDALVNNAAVTVRSDPFDLDTISADDFRQVFDVNVIGNYQMCRAAIPHMRKNGGAIVNVSSNVTLTGGGTSLAYTASKGAVNALTLALARTCGPSIRVNAVCPGVIDTRWMRQAMGQAEYDAFAERNAQLTPLARIASPDDIADAIVWLIEGADFITGETIAVDGGIRLMGPGRKSGQVE